MISNIVLTICSCRNVKAYMRWQFFFCTSSLVWEQCRDTASPSLCNYEAGGSLATMTGQHTADTAKGAYLTVHTSVQSAGGANYKCEQNTRGARWDSISALCRNVTKLPVKRFDLLSMLSVQLQTTCPPFISSIYLVITKSILLKRDSKYSRDEKTRVKRQYNYAEAARIIKKYKSNTQCNHTQ